MSEDFMIPLAAIALPAIIVPTVLGFRHAAKKRDFQHRERMKALETGQPVPGEAGWPVAVATAMIGAGVPLVSFSLTMVASLNNYTLPAEIWIAPTVASVVALIASVSVARAMQHRTTPPAPDQAKPTAYDPDAYDVVGSRG